jgi:hypothetical protein
MKKSTAVKLNEKLTEFVDRNIAERKEMRSHFAANPALLKEALSKTRKPDVSRPIIDPKESSK